MKKGELWIVELPGFGGHEQRGLRPALVVADTASSVAIVVPCTSKLRALRFPYTIQISASAKNGLEAPSVILLAQLRVIDKKRLQKKIGVLEKSVLKEVNLMLRELLAL